MPEIWGMRITHSLLSLPGPLCPGVVAAHRILSTDQIELFDIYSECKQMTYAELNC